MLYLQKNTKTMGPELLLVALVGTLLAGGVSSFFQSKSQKEQQKWSSQMYDKDYENQLSLMDKQNEYNSMPNQVAQAAAAGQNPDYQNFTFQPSAGASLPSAMNIPFANSIENILGSSTGNMFMSSISLWQQGLNMKSQNLDMQAKQAGINESNRQTALRYILDTVPVDTLEKAMQGGTASTEFAQIFDTIKAASAGSSGYFEGLGYSPKQSRAIARQIGTMLRSPETFKNMYDQYVSMRDSGFQYDLSMGNDYRRNPIEEVTQGTREYIDITNEIIGNNLKRDKYQSVADRATSQTESEYRSTLQEQGYGVDKAHSDFMEVDNVEFDRLVRKCRNDIVKKLLNSKNEFVRSLGVTMYFQDHSDVVKEAIANFVAIKYEDLSAKIQNFEKDQNWFSDIADNKLFQMTGPGALINLFR